MTVSARLRFEILKRDRFRCRYCGAAPDVAELHIDHVLAVSRGGNNAPANLVTACRRCNLGKSNVPLETVEAPQSDTVVPVVADLLSLMAWARFVRDWAIDADLEDVHRAGLFAAVDVMRAGFDALNPVVYKLPLAQSYAAIRSLTETWRLFLQGLPDGVRPPEPTDDDWGALGDDLLKCAKSACPGAGVSDG